MGANGRDQAGRFGRGNPGGPGRPPRSVEARYHRALTAACPPELWQSIVEKAVEQALEGDGAARAWLSRFLVGHMSLDVASDMLAMDGEA